MAPVRRWTVASSMSGVKRSRRASEPEIGRLLVGDVLGERPGKAVILAGRVRQALRPRPAEAEVAGLLLQVGGEARLADARIAEDEDDPAAAGPPGVDEELLEVGPIGRPADEQAGRSRPDEPVEALATEPVDADRSGPAADRPLADDVRLEAIPRCSLGRLVDEDLAGLGQLLEADRGHHRLARHGDVTYPGQ